ncbi:MAG: glycoside hydrolase family 3 C-terminal domain-containing protein [Saprospirales bacterium]|nr:glycoside hydrolase family 3 C-terminal domain-containing protein [Saprospirales bacterium]MBK8921920.1 glycoside hydrolase family 3 C-terminal domain-containing protein [Saprospirales bacterium]
MVVSGRGRGGRWLLLSSIALLALSAFVWNKIPAPRLPATETTGFIESKVDSVLVLMTLEEKIGQMTLFTTDWESTGPTIREGYKDDIRQGRCGALFNSHTVRFTRELQRIAVEETRLKIPLLFGYDVIHGYKTIFPIPLAEAASWDLPAIEQAARVAATEAAAAGLHWTFAPMVDISRDPRWGRVMEGAGEDTWLGCRIAEARVRGFQGNGFGRTDALLACVKHYAGYGAPIAGRDYNTVDMSERNFREYYLPPYQAAVKAGAATVMTSFNDYDGVPASGNRYLLTDILRGEWGFDGFVVTDYTSINEMVNHGVIADDKEAGELAVRAGVDMDMQGAVYQRFLKQSVEEGKVPIAAIDASVRRILRLKFELGLFDDPYKYCDAAREQRLILCAPHRAAAREMARKSVVLLKNQNNTLPLSKTARIAVVGPLGDNKSELIGNWCAAGNANDCVSLLEGLKAAGKGDISFAKGCELAGSDKSGFAEAVALAQKSDVVVVAIGEAAQMSGEAASRTDISVPGVQEDLVKALAATGKPVVVVLMNGRPLAIPDLTEQAYALLEAWWLGTETGHALADVLYGDYNPSGKLPMTFPRTVGQVPVFYNEKNTGRPYDPASKWTSRYIDEPNAPLFPFGFGLSYTTFEYSDIVVDKPTFKQGESLRIRVNVRNAGSRTGEEVVQFYVRDLVGSVTRPLRELKGFRKVLLAPGAIQTVEFILTDAELRFFGNAMRFGSEPGDFDLMIGGNSRDTKHIRVTMTK